MERLLASRFARLALMVALCIVFSQMLDIRSELVGKATRVTISIVDLAALFVGYFAIRVSPFTS